VSDKANNKVDDEWIDAYVKGFTEAQSMTPEQIVDRIRELNEQRKSTPLKLGTKMREIQMCKNEEPKKPDTKIVKLRAWTRDGDELHNGALIADFKEELWVFEAVLADGKIYARSVKKNDHRIFFPSVFRIKVTQDL
jgi:hypothetical protein